MCHLQYQNPFLVTKTKTIIYIQLHRNNNSIMCKESLSFSSQFIGIKLLVLSQFQAINNNLSQLHKNHKEQNYNDRHSLKNSTSKLSINFSFSAQNINSTRDITIKIVHLETIFTKSHGTKQQKLPHSRTAQLNAT